MFGRKSKRTQKREAHQKALREGLIFWLPGGSSQINVYLDYCVSRCLGKTKMKEKEREIPFTSIRDVIYTPATVSRMASLQLITKEMPDVKRSYWYAYENNLVVVHPGNEELAQKIVEFQGYGRCPIRSSRPSFSSRRMLHPDRRSSSPKSTPKKRAISGRGNW